MASLHSGCPERWASSAIAMICAARFAAAAALAAAPRAEVVFMLFLGLVSGVIARESD